MLPITPPPFEPIAIIGIGVRGPGGIDSLSTLWDTLVERKSHCLPLAKDPRFHHRFNPGDFKALFERIPDSESSLHANLFDETPGLDRSYFSISKREADGMDARQKLLLHVAHEALEDAGYSGVEDGSAFDPATFGVYVATSTDEIIQDPRDYDSDIYHLVRTERAFLSGQICYHFGLRGPSASVDTAGSGSITAFDDACRALAIGECTAAVAGGVHVVTPIAGPISFYSNHRAGILDRTGQCKPFLDNGTGYTLSEGCGLVVMKRLSDALREGDRIHGVIRSMCIRSMASQRFISQPDGEMQSVALACAIETSGVDPASISFAEAHGMGTAKGDPAEVSSLCSVLAQQRAPDNQIIVGSIKGNVGHAGAASGAHSLAKVIAMFQRRRIPPQADFHPSRMNPALQPFFDKYPIRIIEEEEEWNVSPRIATVGNFGSSGNAGFMVIEEGLSFGPPEGRDIIEVSPLPFVFSAKDQSTLLKLVQRYIDWFKLPSTLSTPLSDISYAMTVRRFLHPIMISVQASSHNDLAQKLQGQPPTIDTSVNHKQRQVAFCFSGQGGERLDPRKSTLYNVSASFTNAVDTCFSIAETENLIAEADRPMLELFALEFSIAEMWKSWGINPVALAGHSFGEYVALVCAGVLTVHDALKLLGIRAALIRERCTDTTSKMAAVRLPVSEVNKCLEQQKSTVVELACINSDNSVTLAGTPEDLESFREELVNAYPAARWQLLGNMVAAFHSRFVQPISTYFTNACKEVEFHSSKKVVLSALLGRTCPIGDDALQQSDYLVRHCRETNRFGTAISDYQRQDMGLDKSQPDWLEIGSHSRTISFISLESGQLKFPSHGKRAEQGWTTALDTFMRLFSAGHTVDFKGFHRDVNPGARHTDLPLYPFESEPHSYPVRKEAKVDTSLVVNTIELHPPVLATDLAPLLRNHVVAGYTLCPATTHMALLLSAVSTSSSLPKGRSAYRISQLKLRAGFTYTTEGWVQVRSRLASPELQIVSNDNQVLISARVDVCKEQNLLHSLSLYQSLILPLKSFKSLPSTDVVRKEMVYPLLDYSVRYGPCGQVLDRAWIAEDRHQAWGYSSYQHDANSKMVLPSSLHKFSPMLLDASCQILWFLINTSSDREPGEIFLVNEFGECVVAFSRLYETKYLETYASYKLVDNGKAALGQVFAFDDKGQVICAFRDLRMTKMKLQVLKRLIDRTRKPGHVVTAPLEAPTEVKEQNSTNDSFEEKVVSVLRNALRLPEIPRDKPLDILGLDSLTAIDVGVQLERLLPHRRDHLSIDSQCTVTSLIQSLHPAVPQLPQTMSESNVKNVETDEFEEKVISVFRGALRLSNLPLDKTLRNMGLDAHTAVDIVVQLRHLVPNLPDQFVIDRQCTLPSLIETLRSLSVPALLPITAGAAPSVVTDSGPPILANVSEEMMQAMSSNPEVTQCSPGPTPLLLIHDGGGTAFAYYSLRNLDRTVIGIHSPGLLEGKGIVNVMHAAHEYAAIARKYLEQNSPEHSKLLIGGWSLGGTIALTIAALYPHLVSGVVLIDSTPPGISGMNAEQAESVLLHSWTRTDGIHGLVRKQLQSNTRAVMANTEFQATYHSIKVPVYLLCAIEPFQPPESLNVDQLPAAAAAWLLSPKRAQISEAAWKAILGKSFVGASTIPGNHWTLFTPVNTITTTEALRRGIDVLEKANNNFAMF